MAPIGARPRAGTFTQGHCREDAIAAHPFRAGLNPHFVHLLNECATLMRVGIDELIFKEGMEADHFYLIHKGQVALETFVPGRGNIQLESLAAGAALGWLWLFPLTVGTLRLGQSRHRELVAFGGVGLRARAEANRDFSQGMLTRVWGLLFDRRLTTRRRLVEFYSSE